MRFSPQHCFIQRADKWNAMGYWYVRFVCVIDRGANVRGSVEFRARYPLLFVKEMLPAVGCTVTDGE